MQTFDPKMLRRLAPRYRERADSEPEKARVFTEIARDMEAHAALTEQQQQTENAV
jgi:hypothetical protein